MNANTTITGIRRRRFKTGRITTSARKGGQETRQNYQEEKNNREDWHYALFNAFLITL